jgi:tetratricopeptide (TPR) repeat protein
MRKVICIFLFFSGCVYFNTFYNAQKYYNDENYKKSIEKCKKILDRHPDSKYVDDALFIMGKSNYYLKNYDEAKVNLKKLIDAFPSSPFVPESYLFLGKIAFEKKNIAEAGLFLEKAAETENSEIRMKILKTQLELYLITDNPEKTIEEGEKFIEKYSSNSEEAYFMIGNANRHIGNEVRALEMYKKAIKESNGMPSARLIYNTAEIYLGMDSLYEAMSVIEEAQSNDSLSLLRGKILLRQQKFEEAVEAFKTISNKNDSLGAIARYSLGEIKEYQKDTSAALEYYEKAASSGDFGEITSKASAKKEILESFSLLRKLSEKSEKDEKDEVLFRSNFERKDSAFIFFRIGELYYWELGELGEGIKWYKKVYEDFPKSAHAPKAIFTLLYICDREDTLSSLNRGELISVLNREYKKSEYAEMAKKFYESKIQDTTGTKE